MTTHSVTRVDLLGPAEVAEVLGVSRQQVHRLARRPDFPRPAAILSGGRASVAPK